MLHVNDEVWSGDVYCLWTMLGLLQVGGKSTQTVPNFGYLSEIAQLCVQN